MFRMFMFLSDASAARLVPRDLFALQQSSLPQFQAQFHGHADGERAPCEMLRLPLLSSLSFFL